MIPSPKHVLVDDVASLRAANVTADAVWSCSSGLAHKMAGGDEAGARQVHSPESLIGQAAYDRIGLSILKARDGFHDALHEMERKDPRFAHLAATQRPQLYFSALAFAVKGLILSKWLEATNGDTRAVIGCPDLAPPRGLVFQVGIHDHVFAAIAREMEEESADDPAVITVPPIDRRKFFDEFAHVPAFDKIFNILNRTPGALAYQLWRKSFSDTFLPGPRGTILLLSENEGIEEAFFKLLGRGWRLVRVTAAPRIPEDASAESARLSELGGSLESIWLEAVRDEIDPRVAGAAWRLMWRRMVRAISVHPAQLRAMRALVADWLGNHGGDETRPVMALGNGLYDVGGRLLDRCLREAGIPVVCTDHGVSKGLGLRHDFNVEESISFSDQYFTFTPEACRMFRRHRREEGQVIGVIGSPKVFSRSRHPRFQRAAARRRLAAKGDRPLLIYVTSLMKNNLPQGLGTSTDFAYAEFQRRLIAELGSFPGDVVIKPYPAHRYADPDQIWLLPLPENARVAPFGEFRHFRWAADLLLLDICSSTMAWAFGCDVPLIYVDNQHTPMAERTAKAFRESVFYVDSRKAGWEEELRTLISTPQGKMRRRWMETATRRAQVSEQFVLGRRGNFAAGLVAALDRIADRAEVAVTAPSGADQDAA